MFLLTHIMASPAQLITLGSCLLFIALEPCIASPTAIPKINTTDNECEKLVRGPSYDVFDCIQMEFTMQKIEEAAQYFNGSECPRCRQFCSRSQPVLECIRQQTINLSRISKRVEEVAALHAQFFEIGISFVCDNNASMFTAMANRDNNQCLRERGLECWQHMARLDFPGTLCDNEDSENEVSIGKYICQSFIPFLECSEEKTESCSSDIKNVITGALSTLKNNGPCAKYY